MGGAGGGSLPISMKDELKPGQKCRYKQLGDDSLLVSIFSPGNYTIDTDHELPGRVLIMSTEGKKLNEMDMRNIRSNLRLKRHMEYESYSFLPMRERIISLREKVGDIDKYGLLVGGSPDVTFTAQGCFDKAPNHGVRTEVNFPPEFWCTVNARPRDAHLQSMITTLRWYYPAKDETFAVYLGSDHSRHWQWIHVLERHAQEDRFSYTLAAKAWIDLEMLAFLGEEVQPLFDRISDMIEFVVTYHDWPFEDFAESFPPVSEEIAEDSCNPN